MSLVKTQRRQLGHLLPLTKTINNLRISHNKRLFFECPVYVLGIKDYRIYGDSLMSTGSGKYPCVPTIYVHEKLVK